MNWKVWMCTVMHRYDTTSREEEFPAWAPSRSPRHQQAEEEPE
jgi:hypothetical protein